MAAHISKLRSRKRGFCRSSEICDPGGGIGGMVMAHRDSGQLGFADHMVMRHSRRNELLTRLAELVDWAALGGIVAGLHDSPHGAPSYLPLAMVKALLLQQWYGLSDPALEEVLWDRLSFRVFCG